MDFAIFDFRKSVSEERRKSPLFRVGDSRSSGFSLNNSFFLIFRENGSATNNCNPEIYNDGLPPNDFQVDCFVHDPESSDLKRVCTSWGSSLEELALTTKFSFFGQSVSYSIATHLIQILGGKRIGEESCRVRALTENEYHRLTEELQKPFNQDAYDSAFEYLTSR